MQGERRKRTTFNNGIAPSIIPAINTINEKFNKALFKILALSLSLSLKKIKTKKNGIPEEAQDNNIANCMIFLSSELLKLTVNSSIINPFLFTLLEYKII